MENKGENRNKIMRFILTIPVKALCKARDLYLWSITGCAARSNFTNGIAGSPLPRIRSSKTVGSSRYGCGGEDYGDLILAASVRRLGHENEIDMVLRQRQSQIASRSENHCRLPKSCSAGMTIIEEENECDFSGDGDDSKVRDSLCARSRSCAVPLTRSLN